MFLPQEPEPVWSFGMLSPALSAAHVAPNFSPVLVCPWVGRTPPSLLLLLLPAEQKTQLGLQAQIPWRKPANREAGDNGYKENSLSSVKLCSKESLKGYILTFPAKWNACFSSSALQWLSSDIRSLLREGLFCQECLFVCVVLCVSDFSCLKMCSRMHKTWGSQFHLDAPQNAQGHSSVRQR